MASDLAHLPSLELGRASERLMTVTVKVEGPDAVLDVEGEIDMSTTPILRTCLDRCAADAGGAVVLDLTKVTFLDSSGVSAILHAHRALTGAARPFVVRNPCSSVRRVLEITGVVGTVSIEGTDGPSCDPAVASTA